MTAAALPRPVETAKIKTHNIVGTALIKAAMPFTILVTPFGAKFWAPGQPKVLQISHRLRLSKGKP